MFEDEQNRLAAVPVPPSSADLLAELERLVQSNKRQQRQSCFRTCRYFTVGHEWFATVREGGVIGPYLSRQDAELALAKHVIENSDSAATEAEKLDQKSDAAITDFTVLLHEFWTCRLAEVQRSENSFYAWAKQRLEACETGDSEIPYPSVRAKALRRRLSELDHRS